MIFAAILLAGVASAPMQPLDLCKMRPIFREEFDTLAASRAEIGPNARWTAHTPWNGDFGDARFMDPGPNGPFSVKNGILTITARKGKDGKWRSGLLAASDPQGRGEAGTRYGYFEARMKMPRGPGTWPAFWLAAQKPASEKRPTIEVDVVEFYGRKPRQFRTALHLWRPPPGVDEIHIDHGIDRKRPVPGRWHRFGARVGPEFITWYLDRKPVWQQPTPPQHDLPLYPIVNLALGAGWPIDKTPNPVRLKVDYVHVYALDPDQPEC